MLEKGTVSILDSVPFPMLKRMKSEPIIIGSKNEVEHVERYHAAFDKGTDEPFPLFNERTFYR